MYSLISCINICGKLCNLIQADEDTRRAMIKSYQTSGGTVLSTNWKEVKEKDYEKDIQPPQGMESRKF